MNEQIYTQAPAHSLLSKEIAAHAGVLALIHEMQSRPFTPDQAAQIKKIEAAALNRLEGIYTEWVKRDRYGRAL